MDAFSGYNQIKLDKVDQEKTSFVTSQSLFLLQSDAIRSQERKRNVSKANEQDVCTSDWEECPSLRG